MVQTYGIAPNRSGSEAPSARNGEETNVLLGEYNAQTVVRYCAGEREGHATLVSCISNLSNTIIGSGEQFGTSHASRTDMLFIVGMLTFPMVCFACQIHIWNC